jgi:hypothetical protein
MTCWLGGRSTRWEGGLEVGCMGQEGCKEHKLELTEIPLEHKSVFGEGRHLGIWAQEERKTSGGRAIMGNLVSAEDLPTKWGKKGQKARKRATKPGNDSSQRQPDLLWREAGGNSGPPRAQTPKPPSGPPPHHRGQEHREGQPQ